MTKRHRRKPPPESSTQVSAKSLFREWLKPTVVLGVVSLTIISFELYKQYYDEPLTITAPYWVSESVFFATHPTDAERGSVVPIRSAVYVNLTNEGNHTVSVAGYSATVRAQGRWQKSAPLTYPADKDNVWVIAVMRHSWISRMDLHTVGFDLKAQHTPLSPGATLSGWIFFRTRFEGAIERAQFKILDSTNAIHTVT